MKEDKRQKKSGNPALPTGNDRTWVRTVSNVQAGQEGSSCVNDLKGHDLGFLLLSVV